MQVLVHIVIIGIWVNKDQSELQLLIFNQLLINQIWEFKNAAVWTRKIWSSKVEINYVKRFLNEDVNNIKEIQTQTICSNCCSNLYFYIKHCLTEYHVNVIKQNTCISFVRISSLILWQQCSDLLGNSLLIIGSKHNVPHCTVTKLWKSHFAFLCRSRFRKQL